MVSSATGSVSIGEEVPSSSSSSRKKGGGGSSYGGSVGPEDPGFWERRLSDNPADPKYYAFGAYDCWCCALCFSGHPDKDTTVTKRWSSRRRVGNRGSRTHIANVRRRTRSYSYHSPEIPSPPAASPKRLSEDGKGPVAFHLREEVPSWNESSQGNAVPEEDQPNRVFGERTRRASQSSG